MLINAVLFFLLRRIEWLVRMTNIFINGLKATFIYINLSLIVLKTRKKTIHQVFHALIKIIR